MAQKTFVVGGKYRNRVGEYEVVSIQGANMQIRMLATGKVIDTAIELQQRILDNIKADEDPWPAPSQDGLAIITTTNLARGIRIRARETNWDADFHNALYGALDELWQNGLMEWAVLVGQLSTWRALRPYSQQEIYQAGLPFWSDLVEHRDRLLQEFGTAEPDFGLLRWQHLEALFSLALCIKGVASPVFASKLCHFLLPQYYPVIDQAFVGVDHYGYRGYWRRCAFGWVRSTENRELRA